MHSNHLFFYVLAEEKRRREFYASRGMAVEKPAQGNGGLHRLYIDDIM